MPRIGLTMIGYTQSTTRLMPTRAASPHLPSPKSLRTLAGTCQGRDRDGRWEGCQQRHSSSDSNSNSSLSRARSHLWAESEIGDGGEECVDDKQNGEGSGE